MTTASLNLNADWGPFSATYLGVARILDPARGALADLALYVGRRAPTAVVLPDNIFGYGQNVVTGDRRTVVSAMPEDVALDYSSFAIRYYLDARGDMAVARFRAEHPERVQCAITFHNTATVGREYLYGLGMLASDARKSVSLKQDLRRWWLPARQYAEIEAYQRVQGMGCRQCLTRAFTWGIEDELLAQAFGGWPGDRVIYRLDLPGALRDGCLYFRYIKYGVVDHPWEIRINGCPKTFRFPQTWAIPGGAWGKNRDAYAEWRLLRVPVGAVPAGKTCVELRPIDPPGNDRARIWLDGILFHEGCLPGDDGTADRLPTALTDDLAATARVELDSAADQHVRMRIRIPDAPDTCATLTAAEGRLQARAGANSFLADLRQRFGLPPVSLERDAEASPWVGMENSFILIPPQAERTVRFTLELREKSRPDAKNIPAAPAGTSGPRAGRTTSAVAPATPRGPYAELAARLRDALLFNVNYPLTICGRISPYYVPAKYFPLPYSWDGGFAAVGLATFAPELAWQQTAFFMADVEYDFPMLYCGSPVPTPLYAFWDVWQITRDLDALARIYPGAKRMHDFYLGRTPGSVVNASGDGLLSTYPYNYNLGIDDHPIQRWAEEQRLTQRGLYSIILMPQILRTARILRNAAQLLGQAADAARFGQDADLLAEIIDRRMWDAASGLYGWLCRNEQGLVEPVVMDGCAGDRSACAFLPLFAGLTTHKDRLVRQMRDTTRFNTPYGISSVDMAAPSFNPRGYWNGAVWPVMQWYIWRGLLEAGEPAMARRVAETILTTWQNSLSQEHYLGEHFALMHARMSGAPNFGGLSAVLLPMHAAYFTPGHVTTVYDVVVLRLEADSANDALELKISAPFLESAEHDLLVNMGQGRTCYAVMLNGRPLTPAMSDEYGHLTLRLPRPVGEDELLVRPAGK